jgi:hypothetical protein
VPWDDKPPGETPGRTDNAQKPSRRRTHALKLFKGGLVGGHLAAAACVLGFWVGAGGAAALSALLAAAVTLLFFAVGQGVQVVVADLSARTVFFWALASYVLRVVLLGLALQMSLTSTVLQVWLHPTAVVVATAATVVGWLAAEFWIFRTLRIPVYD